MDAITKNRIEAFLCQLHVETWIILIRYRCFNLTSLQPNIVRNIFLLSFLIILLYYVIFFLWIIVFFCYLCFFSSLSLPSQKIFRLLFERTGMEIRSMQFHYFLPFFNFFFFFLAFFGVKISTVLSWKIVFDPLRPCAPYFPCSKLRESWANSARGSSRVSRIRYLGYQTQKRNSFGFLLNCP